MKLQLSKGFPYDTAVMSRILSVLIGMHGTCSQEQLIDRLGLPYGIVSNTLALMAASGLTVHRANRLTTLGELVARHDPFMEKTGTLWVCHYQLGSQPDLVVWNTLVNQVLPERMPITLEAARHLFGFLPVADYAPAHVNMYLRKELRSFFAAYTEHGLAKLRYLIATEDGFVRTDAIPVPARVFTAMLQLYRDRHFAGASALTVNDIFAAENSPGRVCGLNEPTVRILLEQLHRSGDVHLESRADLDQVRLCGPNAEDFIEKYYLSGE